MIFGGAGYGAPAPQTDTRYNYLQGGYSWAAAEFQRLQLISTDGVIKNLRFRLSAAPGAGKKYTFTLMLNGNPTALTFDIADADTLGSNMVDEVVVTGGDRVAIRGVPDNTPAATYAYWTSVFEGDNPNESIIMGQANSYCHRTDTEYGQVMTSGTSLSAIVGAENDRRQIIPTSGKIKNFHVYLDLDPGTPPDAYRFTVRLNGATVAQSPIVTITANDKTGSDLVHELAVVAGDYVTLMVEPLNTPSGFCVPSWGLTFEADIDGESIVIAGSYNRLPGTWTRYVYLTQTEGSGWEVTESRRYQLGQICTVKKLHILVSVPPGAGKKWDFAVRVAGASNVVATVADAATTGDSGALEDTVGLSDYMSLESDPDNTPDVISNGYWGFVGYIMPSGSEDLLCAFEVGQGSEGLLGKFEVGQDSAELLGRAAIRHPGSAELLGNGIIRHSDTAELLGKGEIQQSGSTELLGNGIIRHPGSDELLGRAEVQQSGSAELIGRAEIRQSDSAEFLGKADVQQSDSAELLGNAIIRHLGSAELLGKTDVQQSGSAELLGRAEVQQSGSAELLGKFEAQVTAELLGKIEVQQSGSAELLGKAEVQQSGSAELLSKADIRQSGSAELLGRAEVRQPGSAELLGEFIVRHEASADLLGEFIARHEASRDLLGEFISKNVGSADFLGELVVRHPSSQDLLGELIARHLASLDLLGEFIVRQVTSEDLLGELVVRHEASVDLHAAFQSQASVDLLGEFTVRQIATINLLGKFTVKHSAELDLPAKLQVTHSERLLSKLWIRHPYRLWTNRRYVNGVVELDETELDDALLEYVIEGVMNDIRSQLISEAMLVYDSWTDITKTPKLIRRATTYGTVASLYSRDINDPNRRIVMGLRPIRIRAAEVRSAQERAMDYWETRMEKMMNLYLTSGGRRLMIVDTEDEEAVFSLEDIPFYSEDPYKIKVR